MSPRIHHAFVSLGARNEVGFPLSVNVVNTGTPRHLSSPISTLRTNRPGNEHFASCSPCTRGRIAVAVFNGADMVPAQSVSSALYSVAGGAAVASSSSLSPLAAIYMLLLALQYSLQPRITRRFLDDRANKKGVAMMEEICKTILAAVMFAGCGKEVVTNSLRGWTAKSSILLAGLPAVLYAAQGVFTYMAYQNLDSVTFNGLNQLKTLSAALCCFILMGRRQSVVQVFALGLLSVSALVFQGTINVSAFFQRGGEKDTEGSGSGDTPVAEETEDKQRRSFVKGVVPCVTAAFISGLAGALSQKGLQLAGGTGRNPFLYTTELSFFSGVTLLVSMLATKKGRNALQNRGLFDHWRPLTILPIMSRALGGVLTALVHKHAGSVRKGFALILGLIFTGVVQALLDDEGLSLNEILAMVLVTLSSWLHLTYPPRAV